MKRLIKHGNNHEAGSSGVKPDDKPVVRASERKTKRKAPLGE